MTDCYQNKELAITLNRKGSANYTKISYPLRYGIFQEIITRNEILHFNLNQEIIRAVGRTRKWIHPNEWLKRTRGNDWVYYSSGGYTGVFETTGEYYLPNLQYPTNAIIGGRPFKEPAVKSLFKTWYDRITAIRDSACTMPDSVNLFLHKACSNTPEILQKRAEELFKISGGRVTVMPPDARHVDYDIIPLTISLGCLYKCSFCRIKNSHAFALKEKSDIKEQILKLKELYSLDIANYNSLFLGEHDALAAGRDLIIFSVEQALNLLDLGRSNLNGTNRFLFGSVDSLLDSDPDLFTRLNNLFSQTYINIGLESADQETLDQLGKPITAGKVEKAFERIQRLNTKHPNIEITANFVMDNSLPKGHYPAFLRLVRESFSHSKPKGTIYLSPMTIDRPSKEMVLEFNRLKCLSRVPTFLYIIQRL